MKNRLITAAVFSALVTGVAWGQNGALGTISFPNSGAAEAQETFLDGVRMVHSFEWEDAIEAFQEAQRIDPDFVLAYWGEALSHFEGHHFAPTSTDVAAGRAALAKLGSSTAERLDRAPTARERGYLEAVELLYGDGSPEERVVAYSEAMGRLWDAYPDDHEAASLFSVSLMRTKVRGAASLRVDMKAGAIAQMVFRANPDHPGAAHYVIHAYDDPIHAPIALYAADKYAEIAPAAVHALHMPAHIFVQHGMWDRVARSNEASYQASVDRAERKGLGPTRHSWHALYWLQYAYLQQGRYDDAQARIEHLRGIAGREDATQRIARTLRRMEALQTVETERWTVGDLDAVLASIDGDGSLDERTTGALLLASGLSAVHLEQFEQADRAREGLETLIAGMDAGAARTQIEIALGLVEAAIAESDGNAAEARSIMQAAVALADSMEPPSGPPGEAPTDSPIKPAHEAYGEMLLRQGNPEEALALFEQSLLLMPQRSRSLLGAAQAAEELGASETAQRYYEALANIPGAGPDLPGHGEAMRYLDSVAGG